MAGESIEESRKVLEALDKCDAPCGSKDVIGATGLDKKIISKEITALKKKGLVDSPVRCKYGITEEGQLTLP